MDINKLFLITCLCGLFHFSSTALIKEFTVNGDQSVKVKVGDTVTFNCSKLESVSNPTWVFKAVTSGTYIIGGPSLTISSRTFTYSTPAKCVYNGVVECQATLGTTTDSKTVSLDISTCDSIQATTPRNTGDSIQGTTPRNTAQSLTCNTLLFFCIHYPILAHFIV